MVTIYNFGQGKLDYLLGLFFDFLNVMFIPTIKIKAKNKVSAERSVLCVT